MYKNLKFEQFSGADGPCGVRRSNLAFLVVRHRVRPARSITDLLLSGEREIEEEGKVWRRGAGATSGGAQAAINCARATHPPCIDDGGFEKFLFRGAKIPCGFSLIFYSVQKLFLLDKLASNFTPWHWQQLKYFINLDFLIF